MRIIGLDHGTRRIGVAVGDTETGMAFARPALQRRSLRHDLERIGQLSTEESASVVVVGLPLSLDGSEGPQAVAARRFGAELERIGLAVAFEDERLTSWQAGEELRQEGHRVDRASGELDSTAARLILQQYLDAHAEPRQRQPDLAEETE